MTPRPSRTVFSALLLTLAFCAPARAQETDTSATVDATTGADAVNEPQADAEAGLPPPIPAADRQAPVRLADTIDVPQIGRRIARFAFHDWNTAAIPPQS